MLHTKFAYKVCSKNLKKKCRIKIVLTVSNSVFRSKQLLHHIGSIRCKHQQGVTRCLFFTENHLHTTTQKNRGILQVCYNTSYTKTSVQSNVVNCILFVQIFYKLFFFGKYLIKRKRTLPKTLYNFGGSAGTIMHVVMLAEEQLLGIKSQDVWTFVFLSYDLANSASAMVHHLR